MVQAILENRKTMTRRTKGLEKVNENPNDWTHFHTTPDGKYFNFKHINHATMELPAGYSLVKTPNQVGDVFWVRENYYTASNWDHWKPSMLKSVNVEVFYVADLPNYDIPRPLSKGKTRPCIFLPKEYARIFLKIKSIRIERLQDISEEDIKNEGVQLTVDRNGYVLFELGEKCSALFFSKNISIMSQYEIWKTHWAALWCKINSIESWKSNPYVFVYEFEQIEKPKDFIL